jgi:peptide/nickel transport system permease protein
MIRDAIEFKGLFLTDAWKWWLAPPVVALVLLILAITLVGTAAEARLSPWVARHAS